MVVDTSAIVAILLNEPDADLYEAALSSAQVRLVSAATFVELSIVIEAKLGVPGARELDALMLAAHIELVPGDGGSREPRPCRVAPVRQGSAPRRSELRRLLLVRAVGLDRLAAPVQGRRFHADGNSPAL